MDWAVIQGWFDTLVSGSYVIGFAALLLSAIVKDPSATRVSLVFIIISFLADILTQNGSILTSHETRQGSILALNIIGMVAVMWKPAGQIQQWFGSCYLATAMFVGTYLILFPGNAEAYGVAYAGGLSMYLAQILLLLVMGGGIVSRVGIDFISSRFGVVFDKSKANTQ